MTVHRIDLNADVGENPKALTDGREAALMGVVTSVNCATGAHAGDEDTIRRVAAIAREHNVAFGAHPSYPDRAGFGRTRVEMDADALRRSLDEQLTLLHRIAADEGVPVTHIKPHGALYHDGAEDDAVAQAFASSRGVQRVVLPPTATTTGVFLSAGMRVVFEGFADRAYEQDGRLRDRRETGALIEDPALCAQQALRLINEGIGNVPIDTICVHSDTPDALEIAKAVRTAMENAGIRVAALA